MATLDRMAELRTAYEHCKRIAEDATYMGTAKQLAAAWYDLDMIATTIEKECGCTPGGLEQQLAVWQGLAGEQVNA